MCVGGKGIGGEMGLLRLPPKADCAHALGALGTFGGGFNGDMWEEAGSLVDPPEKPFGMAQRGVGVGEEGV